jgi:hypothetical protein
MDMVVETANSRGLDAALIDQGQPADDRPVLPCVEAGPWIQESPGKLNRLPELPCKAPGSISVIPSSSESNPWES